MNIRKKTRFASWTPALFLASALQTALLGVLIDTAAAESISVIPRDYRNREPRGDSFFRDSTTRDSLRDSRGGDRDRDSRGGGREGRDGGDRDRGGGGRDGGGGGGDRGRDGRDGGGDRGRGDDGGRGGRGRD